jgi:hypothetical protein
VVIGPSRCISALASPGASAAMQALTGRRRAGLALSGVGRRRMALSWSLHHHRLPRAAGQPGSPATLRSAPSAPSCTSCISRTDFTALWPVTLHPLALVPIGRPIRAADVGVWMFYCTVGARVSVSVTVSVCTSTPLSRPNLTFSILTIPFFSLHSSLSLPLSLYFLSPLLPQHSLHAIFYSCSRPA